jgi:hypothetical protein
LRIILKIIAVIFLIGGAMGLVKGIFPQLEWLSFRHFAGSGQTFYSATMILVERIYGIVMAVLEVLMAVLLLISPIKYLKLALVVVSVNAIGCAAAVMMGDIFAAFSLLLRLSVICLLICANRLGKSCPNEIQKIWE